mgnify:FL=1
MNFYVLRRGQKLGPYPDGVAEEMSAAGELKAGDLVCYEGEQNWVPVSRFLEHRLQRAETPETDAVLTEAEAASAPAPTKTSFLRRTTEGEDDASLSEAEREVIAGGRYVVFEYCWSLIISFRRRSKPVLVRAGDDGFAAALRYSLVSVLFGWWGIPGPLWAISTLRHNAGGGEDATLATLTQQVGHARAAAACARHRASPRPGALMASLGGMMTALSLAVCLGAAWLVWAAAYGDFGFGEQATGPGAKEFQTAYQRILQAKTSSIFSNDPKTLELADGFNKGLTDAYVSLARQNPTAGGFETNKPVIVTYCEWHQDRVVFLVQVGGLHKLPDGLRNSFADEAWRASSMALTDAKLGFVGLRVAVGLGSITRFDQVLMGRYIRDFEANNTGLKTRSEGHQSRSRLYPLFVPLEQIEALKDE